MSFFLLSGSIISPHIFWLREENIAFSVLQVDSFSNAFSRTFCHLWQILTYLDVSFDTAI